MNLYASIVSVTMFSASVINAAMNDEFGRINPAAVPVSFINLIATPDEYDGKVVRLYAVILYDFEANYLVFSKERAALGDLASAIGYDVDAGGLKISEDVLQGLNQKYVVVEGEFATERRRSGERINRVRLLTRIARAEP